MENGKPSERSPALPQAPPTSLQPARSCDYAILDNHSTSSTGRDSGPSSLTTNGTSPSTTAARAFSQLAEKDSTEVVLLSPVLGHQGIVGDTSFAGESSLQLSTKRVEGDAAASSSISVVNCVDVPLAAASAMTSLQDDEQCISRHKADCGNAGPRIGAARLLEASSRVENGQCSEADSSSENKSSSRLTIAKSLHEAAMLLTRATPLERSVGEERWESGGVQDRQRGVETGVQTACSVTAVARAAQQHALTLKAASAGGAQGNACVQVADSDWLRAIQVQAVGACRSDDRLRPMMRWNLTCFGADGQVLVDLGQHFKAKEMAMLVRCLLAPLVSVRVGKVAQEGRLLVPLPTKGCLSLVMLPGSELRLYFASDGGGSLERLAMLTGGSESTSIKMESLAEDTAGRTFSLRLPSGRRTYFWQAEKSKAVGDDLLKKLKDLVANPPTLTDLTGINEGRLDAFAQILRAALLTAPGPTPVDATTPSSPLPRTHLSPSSPPLAPSSTLSPASPLNCPPLLPSKLFPSPRGSFQPTHHLPTSVRTPFIPRRPGTLTRRNSFPPPSHSHLPLNLYRSSGELQERPGNTPRKVHLLASAPLRRALEPIPLLRADASGMPLLTTGSKDDPDHRPLTQAELPLSINSRKWDLLPPPRRVSRVFEGGSSSQELLRANKLKLLQLQAATATGAMRPSLYQQRQMVALRDPLTGHAKGPRSRQARGQDSSPYWVHTPSSSTSSPALSLQVLRSAADAAKKGASGLRARRVTTDSIIGCAFEDLEGQAADVDADVIRRGQSPEQIDTPRQDPGHVGSAPSLPQSATWQSTLKDSMGRDSECKASTSESLDQTPLRCGCHMAGLEAATSTSSNVHATSLSQQRSESCHSLNSHHQLQAQENFSFPKRGLPGVTQTPNVCLQSTGCRAGMSPSPTSGTLPASLDLELESAGRILKPNRPLGRGQGWIASDELEQRHGVWLPAHHHSHLVASPPHIPPPSCPQDLDFQRKGSRAFSLLKGKGGSTRATSGPAVPGPNFLPKRPNSELHWPMPGSQWHSGPSAARVHESSARLGAGVDKVKEDRREVRGHEMVKDGTGGVCENSGPAPSGVRRSLPDGKQSGEVQPGIMSAGMPGSEVPGGVAGGIVSSTVTGCGSLGGSEDAETGRRKLRECLPLGGALMRGLREFVAVQDEGDEVARQDWHLPGGAASGRLSQVNRGIGRGFVFVEKAGRRCGLGILSDSRFGGNQVGATRQEGHVQVNDERSSSADELQVGPTLAAMKSVDCPGIVEALPSVLETGRVRALDPVNREKDEGGLP